MIKKVTINSFQSHEDTTFDLSNGMSVIIGASDAGKSAFARAIQCVIRRTPFYLNWKPNVTEGYVELEFDDCVIARHYKKVATTVCPTCKAKLGTNKAKCQECNSLIPDKPAHDYYMMDGVKYERFGVNLPDEIINKIKMCEVDFSGLKVNINTQNQFDDNFFIGNSFNGTNRNKLIGGLIPDSDIIGEVITECNDDKNNIRAEIKFLDNSYKSSKKKIEDTEVAIEEIKKLYSEIEQLETIALKCTERLNKLKKIKIELEAISNLSLLERFISMCDKFKTSIYPAMDKYIKDDEHIDKIKNINTSLLLTIDRITAIYIPNIDLDIKDTKMLLDVYNDDNHRINALNKISNEISMLKDINDVHIPEFKVDVVERFVNNITLLKEKILKINQIGQRVIGTNTVFNDIHNTLESENNLKEITIKKFKEDNPNLICPQINDIYCEECLMKVGRV